MSYIPEDTHMAIWEAENRVTPSEAAWEHWAEQARAFAAQTCQHHREGIDPLDNGGPGDPDGDGCSLDGAYDYWQAGYSPRWAVLTMRDIRFRFDELSSRVGATLRTFSRPDRWHIGSYEPRSFSLYSVTGNTLVGPFVAPSTDNADMFMYVARATWPSGQAADLAFAGIVSPDLRRDSQCLYFVSHDFTPNGVPRAWTCSAGSPRGSREPFLTYPWRNDEGYNAAFAHGIDGWKRHGATPSTLPSALTPYRLQPHTPVIAATIAAQATPNPASAPAQPAPLAVPAATAVPARHL